MSTEEAEITKHTVIDVYLWLSKASVRFDFDHCCIREPGSLIQMFKVTKQNKNQKCTIAGCGNL